MRRFLVLCVLYFFLDWDSELRERVCVCLCLCICVYLFLFSFIFHTIGYDFILPHALKVGKIIGERGI